MKTFDPNKPVQTRDGRKARIIAQDLSGAYPIVAVITQNSGNEFIETFRVIEDSASSASAAFGGGARNNDLVNVPQETFHRVYTTPSGKVLISTRAHDTLAACKSHCTGHSRARTIGYVSYPREVKSLRDLTLYAV